MTIRCRGISSSDFMEGIAGCFVGVRPPSPLLRPRAHVLPWRGRRPSCPASRHGLLTDRGECQILDHRRTGVEGPEQFTGGFVDLAVGGRDRSRRADGEGERNQCRRKVAGSKGRDGFAGTRHGERGERRAGARHRDVRFQRGVRRGVPGAVARQHGRSAGASGATRAPGGPRRSRARHCPARRRSATPRVAGFAPGRKRQRRSPRPARMRIE